jgi:HSP20 family molecular chaperone IbpA
MKNTAIEKKQQNSQQANVPERLDEGIWYTPLCDIVETDDAFLFQADLPGVKSGDLDVSYESGTLTIDAKVQPRQQGNTQYAWREYGVGHFHRSFSINTPINVEGIQAQLKNGELSLYVPKAESAKPKRIKVKEG